MTRDELTRYIAERYATDPEYPWGDDNCIFRHSGNRKWFALCMRLPYARLGIEREGETDVVNLKCAPQLMGAYRGLPGVFPGYHMNKEHWLTVLLDDSAEDEALRELLELSYELTRPKRRRKKGMEERFYGAEAVTPEIRALYRDLRKAWCAETCAPRLRPNWSPENPTLGQCSITAFLVQDLLGGKVYGVPLPDGQFHCFNVVGELCFDLTSEQFGDEKLDYRDRPEQLREVHFAQGDKKARYELLKARLAAVRE